MLCQIAAATAKKMAAPITVLGSAEPFEQRQQHQAPGGGPQQVEEVDPADPLDGLRNSQRDDRPGQEERHRRGEVHQRVIPELEIRSLRQIDRQGTQHADAIDRAQPPQLDE
jgi:hypothetical protein